MQQPTQNLKQQAKRVYKLLKVEKRLFLRRLRTTDFKEPVLFLIRRSGRVEFYQDVTSGEFEFENSDGKQMKLYLAPEYLLTFDYGNKTFKGYICYEDETNPYPQKPILSAVLTNAVIDKTLNDLKSWKAKELEAKATLIWKIMLGVVIIILAIIAWRLLIPQKTQTVVTLAENLTNAIQVPI